MKNLLSKNVIYASVFVILLLIYGLFFARMGFELWDTGYIPSYSWRIVNGQNVYEDFVYKAPPITLYFHALFMKIFPNLQQFWLIKICNYLLFAVQVMLCVFGFKNFYPNKISFNIWSLISFSFAISLLNFTAYPWPTTDGLLFASVAFFILSLQRKNLLHWFLIALFVTLSSLTKQSFYLIPIGFIVTIYFMFERKNLYVFLLSLIICYGLFFLWIETFTSWETYRKQTTGETHFIDLFYTGFLNYFINYGKKIIIPLFLIAPIALFFNRKNFSFLKFFKIIAVVLIGYSIILCIATEFLFASRIAFIGTGIFVIVKAIEKKNLKNYFPVFLALLLAWSCSVSMGYNYPILFSTGIIMSIVVVLQEYLVKFKSNKLILFLGILLTFLAMAKNFNPYREANILELNHDLGEVSPKLAGINTSEKTKNKLVEAKKLIEKYGEKYIMAPGFPMAHYIFDTQSVMKSDWLTNNEINRQAGTYIETAARVDHFVFLEKSFIEGELYLPENRSEFSAVTVYILNNFKKIEETEHFIIFNTNEKKSALPVLISKSVY
ncbi:hypothetical protein GV828_09010 [Flavobacterium sp. NST-5]|uniref:Glycosyltransferase RgtA/B/C/D-like domain-containing protein n=1 Tax=Flavobacterium ichthyis TaxID=2698827 RepID=A0ABW9Z9G8_9FLAO|nr:hypothetical protein [Flavobacterium ichthyis]NBL65334.1 hypothetical protein [Flavobacterium ichthyis]